MKTSSLFIFCFFGFTGLLSAQYNLSSSYLYQNDVYTSRLQPSQLNLGTKTVQIGLPGLGGAYMYAGNTIVGFSQISNTLSSSTLDMKDIYDNADKKRLIFGLGADVLAFAGAAQFEIIAEKKLNVGFTVSQRGGFYAEFPYEALSFIYKGNGSPEFRGKTAQLGKINISGATFTQYALHVAMPIFGNDGSGEGLGMRAGMGFKLLQGQLGLNMKDAQINIFTEQNGNYLVLNRNFNIAYTDVREFNRTGRGFGLDLGTTLYYGDKWEFIASVTDIGHLRFTKNVISYSASGNDTVSGVINSFFGGEDNNIDVNKTSEKLVEVNERKGDSFTIPIGARLMLQSQYKLGRSQTTNGREYYKNRIFFTYMQGLANVVSTTTRPYLNVGYNHGFGSFFNAGLSLGYGSINRSMTAGLFCGFTGGSFKFGLGSDNLLGAILPSVGTGADFAMNMLIGF